MKTWGINKSRKEYDKISEAMIISAFIHLKKYSNYILDIESDPPDAIVRMPQETVWLEASLILQKSYAQYLYDKNYKFESDLSEQEHIDCFISKIIEVINEKDSNENYLQLKKHYGKGILLLEIIDPFISVIDNSEIIIARKIIKFYENANFNYFKEIYLYRIPTKEGNREFLKLY